MSPEILALAQARTTFPPRSLPWELPKSCSRCSQGHFSASRLAKPPQEAPSWGHFRHFWRPSSAKFGPKRVLEAYQHQKRDFSPNTRPRVRERKFGVQDGLQKAPRSAQDGSKTLLKSNFFALKNRLKFGFVLGAILVDFGSQNGAPSGSVHLRWVVWKLIFFCMLSL